MSWPRCVIETLEIARELVCRKDSPRAPVDICQIAHCLGIGSVESQEMAADGYLGEQKDGTFVIRYRIGNDLQRRPFHYRPRSWPFPTKPSPRGAHC